MDNPPPSNKSNGNAGPGIIIGLLLAYPVSYWFQPGVIRAKLSLGDYISKFSDVIQSKDLQSAIITSFIACPVVLGIVWYLATKRR